jgi:mycofactocin system glycosyltransferase
VLDRRVRRLDGGRILLGGEPFRLLKLSERGVAAVEAGDPEIIDRLVEGGLAHPKPPLRRPRQGEIVIVVPVLDDAWGLERLLPMLSDEAVVVVDDGSRPTPASTIAHLTTHAGARLVRHDGSLGPAAARNAARRAVEGVELVGFLDSDAVAESGWLEPLLGHFDDSRVGAVAPRVRATAGLAPRWLAAYEAANSPLDLGSQPGRVGAHRRLSYAPSAALVCRRAALDDVGWFDPALRFGEDVDLLRRLEDAGWVTRYEPASVVDHDCRPGLRAFASQRYRYGRSAAALDARHPGTVAPLEASPWSGATIGAGLVAVLAAARGRRRLAAASTVTTAVLVAIQWITLCRRLRSVESGGNEAGRTAASLVLTGTGWAAVGAMTAVRRVWWPPVLLAAVTSRRARRGAALLTAVSEVTTRLAGRDGRRAPAGLELTLGLLDDAAYGLGAWAGCARERSLRALAPRRAPRTGRETPSQAATDFH